MKIKILMNEPDQLKIIFKKLVYYLIKNKTTLFIKKFFYYKNIKEFKVKNQKLTFFIFDVFFITLLKIFRKN